FAIVIGALPVLLVSALGIRRNRPYGEFRLGAVSFATLASVAAARALSSFIEWLGGYRVVPLKLLDSLAYRDSLQTVVRNALSLAENLPLVCRSAIPNEFTAPTILAWLGCLIGPLLLCWAYFRRTSALFGRRDPARGAPADFIGDVLLVSTA